MTITVPESPLFWSDQGIFADMPSYGLAGALPSLASPPRTPEAKVDEIRGGSLSYVSAMPQCDEGSPSGDQKLMPTVSRKDARNEKKATALLAGTRLVRTTTSQVGGPHSRTCLLDAISFFITAPQDKQRLRADVLACMPAKSDASISQIWTALARNCIFLKRVTKAYLKKGGAPFYLFQRGECQLIVMIKLTNQTRETVKYFIA